MGSGGEEEQGRIYLNFRQISRALSLRAKRSNRKVLGLLRFARNDKYLTGHDIISPAPPLPISSAP